MKNYLAVLIVSFLPTLALAAGDHAGGHGTSQKPGSQDMGHNKGGGHDMDGHQHGAGGHAMGHQDMHDAGAGRPGDPAKVSRTIEVAMDDNMRFTPDRIRVKAGETVRFFVRNSGKLQHEFVLGTMAELKEHAAMMRAQPDMKHAEPNMASLSPGKLGGVVWQFDKPGTVDFACLIPGHLEAGMAGKIKVE